MPEKKSKPFHFKQFTVEQDRCAMKVGTDGVLLGAWAPVNRIYRALDIGSGCGLISLMLAQRNPSLFVVGLELDCDAAEEGKENFAQSPFANRLEMHCADALEWRGNAPFDLVVSNPPFFSGTPGSPVLERHLARHDHRLPLQGLIEAALRNLAQTGELAMVWPANRRSELLEQCAVNGLYPRMNLRIHPRAEKEAVRDLFLFSKQKSEMKTEQLHIELGERGDYSAAYRTLLKDYLTIF